MKSRIIISLLILLLIGLTNAYLLKQLKSNQFETVIRAYKKQNSDSTNIKSNKLLIRRKKITKTIPINDGIDINDLEKQVLTKYGSNVYKNVLEGNDDDNDDELIDDKPIKPSYRLKGPVGFEPTDKQSTDSTIDLSTDSKPKDKLVVKSNRVDNKPGKQIDNNEESYRFRKPTMIITNPIVNNTINNNLNKTKTKDDKNQFFEFTFTDNDNDLTTYNEIFSKKSFEALGIKNKLILSNIESMRLTNPTRIQELTIPALFRGSNTIIQAQTGSGKTLAFLIPLIETIDGDLNKVQAIILAPSRELVTQISMVCNSLFRNTNIRNVAIIGGANVKNQVQRIREDKPQIVIATPGRLAELVFGIGKLKLTMIRAVIVDEIDNMLDEAFVDELQTILEATPVFSRHIRSLNKAKANVIVNNTIDEDTIDSIDEYYESDLSKQRKFSDDDEEDEDLDDDIPIDYQKSFVCFASATSNNPIVQSFANKLLSENEWVTINSPMGTILPRSITHGLISTPRMRALEQLKRFLNTKPKVENALIFVNDPYRVELLCDQLLEMGFIAAPLHGDSSKDDRKEVMARLRDGRINLVVTTELAARGIDIPNLTHVINFELPTDSQHYIHRAGRCGRAGKQGLVMNFANPDTKFVVRRFGKQLKIKMHDCEIREGKVFLKIS